MPRIQCLSFDGIFIAVRMRAARVYSVFCRILEEDIVGFRIRRWKKKSGGVRVVDELKFTHSPL